MRFVVAFAMMLSSSIAVAQEATPQRVLNTDFSIPGLPYDSEADVALQPFLPQFDFTQATFVAPVPDGSGDYLVTERPGLLYRIASDPAAPSPGKQLILDLREQVEIETIEQGLLSVAFSPRYAEDKTIFANYTPPGKKVRLSRFIYEGGSSLIDPATEDVILEVDMPFIHHNGGVIRFDENDLLYISFGDGGHWGDPFGHGQNTATLVASMVRLDVFSPPDPGLNYAIPPDNPFVNGGPAGEETRPEIFAYGLRNPFRFSIDPITGVIYLGDVGQQKYEEINIIEAGQNYGWDFREGFACYDPPSNCPSEGLTPPILDYGRSRGSSVVGGAVYRGEAIPSLYGKYVFGDTTSGFLMTLEYDHERRITTGPDDLLTNTGVSPVAIEPDHDGELLVVNFTFDPTTLYKLVPTTTTSPARIIAKTEEATRGLRPATQEMDANQDGTVDAADLLALVTSAVETSSFPYRLSDMPLLYAAGKGEDLSDKGIYRYQPSATLWSDGTHKERFLALPGEAQMEYVPENGFIVPNESILVKNFLLPLDESSPNGRLQRIETRIMLKREGRWYGFSYRWDEAEEDGFLVPKQGQDREFVRTDSQGSTFLYNWHYPSRNECMQCHTAVSNAVLGVTAPALNHPVVDDATSETVNRFEHWASIGMFVSVPEEPTGGMPSPWDETASLNARARAYLAMNCANCHQPGSPVPVNFDMGWLTSTGRMALINNEPAAGDMGLENPKLIDPGSPETSTLLARINTRGEGQMPPLASSLVDHHAVALISDWIEDMGRDSNEHDHVFTYLIPQHWTTGTFAGQFYTPTIFEQKEGLGAFRESMWSEAAGFWTPRQPLAPLEAGIYELTFRYTYGGGFDWDYYPEAFVRVVNEQGRPISDAAFVSNFEDREGGKLVLQFRAQPGQPWSVQAGINGYQQQRPGGLHMDALDLRPVDAGTTVSVQAPIITAPVAYSTGATTPTIVWTQPLAEEAAADGYRVVRDYSPWEYDIYGQPEAGTNPGEVLAELPGTARSFTVTAPLPTRTPLQLRVIAIDAAGHEHPSITVTYRPSDPGKESDWETLTGGGG